MTEYEAAPQAVNFKDRKTRLVVFGILQVIFGGLCALLVPMMILSMIMVTMGDNNEIPRPQIAGMIGGMAFYVLLAAWFITMGVGSIRTRRWARALILISSWIWLACGVMGFAFMLLCLPSIYTMYDQLGESGRIPPGMVVVIKFAVMAFTAVFYMVIPAMLVLAYSGRNVKATCESRDTCIRWTDACPLPVLGVSLMCAFWAVSILGMGLYGWVFPFFGTIVSGLSGACVMAVLVLLLIWSAWGLYKLDIRAWWCVLLVNAGWIVSSMITFTRVSLWEFYEKMNISGQQLEHMEQFTAIWERYMHAPLIIWMVIVAVYLVWIRKYFMKPSPQV